MPMRKRGALRRLLACIVALCASAAGAADKPYEFGVFPYLPATRIHELHAPMAADFEAKLARPVRLSSKSAYAAFSKELRRQTYDLALIQPFDYVDAYDKHGYLPLARRGEELQAIIVVRDDSPLRTLNDLRSRTLASPPADAAVSQLARVALLELGIDPKSVRQRHERNHFTCLQTLLVGIADACITAEQALRTLQAETRALAKLRVIHTTEPIPHSLFVVHRRVSRQHREILLDTIVGWPRTEEGRRLLERGRFTPFVAARNADYEAVRRYLRKLD